MPKRLVYSKHLSDKRCGVAYFAQMLAEKLSARHVNGFHGFSQCDELYINMDIFELSEAEVRSLLNFIISQNIKKTILLMHDYRFSYLEDELIKHSQAVINLSGEPSLKKKADGKLIELFTPSVIEDPVLKFKKDRQKHFSLSFGFFNPRKKSFKSYISFYEEMLKKQPDWSHIIIVSSHAGEDSDIRQNLTSFLEAKSILVSDYMPNQLLSELISAADIGVFFYPTGIMQNNMGPMAFFSQGKTVITTYGKLTPPAFKEFTVNFHQAGKFILPDIRKIVSLGSRARTYYRKYLDWEIFIKKMTQFLEK